jgi:hypothetical protein
MLRDNLASFQYSFNDLKDMRTLIAGDVGPEKTELLLTLLNEAVKETREKITVLDFASPGTASKGEIYNKPLSSTQAPNVKVISSRLIKATLHSVKSADDLIRLADYNLKITRSLLGQYLESPTRILFVNEVSVHLLRGTLKLLWDCLRKAETVLASGYMGGRTLEDYGTGIFKRENLLMRRLSAKMDRTINL